MALSPYDTYFRVAGVRTTAHLTTPPLINVAKLQLPRAAVLHYLSNGQLDLAPSPNDPIFLGYSKPILINHQIELVNPEGRPVHVPAGLAQEIKDYHASGRNRRFRRLHDLASAIRDEPTLVVYNYGYLNKAYKYPRSMYSEFYRWHNDQKTMWANIVNVIAATQRQQFIRCHLPKLLPSISEMKTGEGGLSQRVVNLFDSPESLMLLELWKWFGKDRQTSLLAHLNDEQAHHVNLVFVESGRWFVVNLGLMNDWRKATDEELATNPKANRRGIAASDVQIRFLRLMMALFEVRTVAGPETDARTEAEKAIDAGQSKTVVQPSAKVPKMDRTTGKVVLSDPEDDTTLVGTGDQHAATETGDDVKADPKLTEEMAEALNKLEFLAQQRLAAQGQNDETVDAEPPRETPEERMLAVLDQKAADGYISGAEYNRFTKLAASYKTMLAPDGSATLEHFIKIDPALVKIDESPSIVDIPTVIDKTMLKSSLLAYDSRYVKNVFQRDVAGMVMSVQNAGIAVTGFDVEEVENITGGYRSYTLRVAPIEGAASTLRFKLPIVDEEGTYRANGINYKLRKQDIDLPIRKVAPSKVALTSYYGKTFVTLSDKRVNDYATWLTNNVMAKGLDDADLTVVDLYPANVFDNKFLAPRLYSSLAMRFRGITVAGFAMNFDHTKRESLYTKEVLAQYEKDGALVVGSNKKNQFMVMDKNGVLYIGESGVLKDLGTLESLIHLDSTGAPVDFAELKVRNRTIPLGVVLGYEMGLTKLMRLLKVEPRRVPAGGRKQLQPNEYALEFSDESLIFDRNDRKAALVLAGFKEFHRAIRNYSVYEFDRPAVYLNTLESNGLKIHHLREIDLMYQMFVDSITKELLIEMKEPTDFRGLLLRSAELLMVDYHPDENDAAFMRKRGYERMAGAVYTNLIESIRAHNSRGSKSKVPIELHPYAVWKTIAEDASVSLVSEINPIQDLKEKEAVTSGGTGGRSSRSMTKKNRSFHRNAMGTISESTVDSSDVGINTYTSADPQFTSLRGISRRYDKDTHGATALLSTSALTSVGADMDDPRRVNFIGIQNGHTVSCNGYRQLPVRTGYEQVIAHRTSSLFAASAKKDGKVVAVNDSGIMVEYADGEIKGFPLGRKYGAAAGMTIPHTLVTELKEGQKFKAGDIITYNNGFFERDVLNPKNVVWMQGALVKVALMENPATLEDSSMISPKVSDLMRTKITKVRMIKLNFDQVISRVRKPGEVLKTEDILCVIEDSVTANQNLFDETSLDTLRALSAHTPTAKAKGVLEHIEVFYHGDKEDMSESLRALATACDKGLVTRQKAEGKKAYTGQVDDSFRVEGDPLMLDTLVIKFYITSEVPAGEGDKGVFANQLKTVFGKVMTGEVKSESGVIVDAIFGAKSVDDRIVNSPYAMGTTTTLLKVLAKRAVKAYRS